MDMDKIFHQWATVELLGKEGENYADVVKRISKEALSESRPTPGWSFTLLRWDEILDRPESPPSPPRYVWKDPAVKNTIRKPRKPRKPRRNVSRETLTIMSVVEDKIDKVPVDKAGDEGTPIVMTRAMEVALMTKRQEELAMKILLGKEYDGKD
jgi:hypothetical protein